MPNHYSCTIEGCTSARNVSHHRFPWKDRALLMQWLRICGKRASELTSNSRVCGSHFTPEDFQLNTERRMLKRFAVPNQRLPSPLPEDADLGLASLSLSKATTAPIQISYEDYTEMEESFVSLDDDSNQSSRRSVPTRKAKDRSLQFQSSLESSEFLGEFDPVNSAREKRKIKQKKVLKNVQISRNKQPSIYNAKGVLIHFDKDVCDCLEDDCPGCHFPCSKCESCKCGHECRQNRKWQYESLEIEGSSTRVQLVNPNLVPKT